MIKTIELRYDGYGWTSSINGIRRLLVCEEQGTKLGFPSLAKVEISDCRVTGFTKVRRFKIRASHAPVTYGRLKMKDHYLDAWSATLFANGFSRWKPFWVRISPVD